MALHSQKLCELTGLQYIKPYNTYCGTLQGYPVFLKVIPRRDTVVFSLIAKAPSDAAAAALQGKTGEWCRTHSGVSVLTYKDRRLAAAVSLTPKNTEENLSAITAALVSLAVSESLVPCCMSCGTESGYQMHLLDGDGVTVCGSCKPYVEQKISEAANDAAAAPVNPFGHIAGALIGAVVLFILTFLVLQLRYLSVLTGFAGVLLALYLMKKLGKKLTVPAIILCGVLCLTAGISATLLHFAGTIAEYNTENAANAQQVCDAYKELEELILDLPADEPLPEKLNDMPKYRETKEQAECILAHTDTKSCLTDLPELLKMEVYDDLQPEVFKVLLCSLTSVLGCILCYAIPMLRKDQGEHTLLELSV